MAVVEGDGGGVKESRVLVTRDLLGGCGCALESKELDLDLQVPVGWEKRLDLKSGKVYLQKCNSTSTSSSSSDHKRLTDETVPKLQDLNSPPSLKRPLNLFDNSGLYLKLVPSLTSSSTYRSVCTLDKVKSALERAENETIKKRSLSMSKSSSLSSNSSSSSIREIEMDHEEKSSSSFAAGCPSCLLYVLISKSNPKCPRCNVIVPSPVAMKKPRIHLNISI
ncbi:uncharacterized protein LOC132301436 [Cornus florida]|uniref:uncharacterized protein LOC132301436 n=1 Tax=Cornus florida TaxID=4283 RepID=UPI00289D8173|nr:uncharacterized protein LOC132301436 [Cornus florida]